MNNETNKTNNNGYINMDERKWEGFVQVLTTPPEKGGDTIIWPNGRQRIWNSQKGEWDCTSVYVTDPPKDSESNIRRVYSSWPNKSGETVQTMNEYQWDIREQNWRKSTYIFVKSELCQI